MSWFALPGIILILVANPLDAMVHGPNSQRTAETRIIGMAGVLNSARMPAFIAQALGVPGGRQAMVLGTHGDTMVPLLDTTVKERLVSGMMPNDQRRGDRPTHPRRC